VRTNEAGNKGGGELTIPKSTGGKAREGGEEDKKNDGVRLEESRTQNKREERNIGQASRRPYCEPDIDSGKKKAAKKGEREREWYEVGKARSSQRIRGKGAVTRTGGPLAKESSHHSVGQRRSQKNQREMTGKRNSQKGPKAPPIPQASKEDKIGGKGFTGERR